jgi:hypothetical protein
MAEALLEEFEMFFIELPAEVRNDLWFMMAILSDENFVFNDGTDIQERAALGLFQARTRIGRLGNLIQAAAIFDVYFAMDPAERFETGGAAARKPVRKAPTALYRYANQIEAIEATRQRWYDLRATKFSLAAIALALIPPGLPNKRTRRVAPQPTDHNDDLQEVSL